MIYYVVNHRGERVVVNGMVRLMKKLGYRVYKIREFAFSK